MRRLYGGLCELPIQRNSMMRLAIALVMATVTTPGALAAEPTPEVTVFGAWSVDTARLPMPPEARPRSVVITFRAEPGSRLRTRVEVNGPTGLPMEADGITPLDGSPTPVKSNFEADMSATIMPRRDVLIMQLAKDGHPASTRIYSVSEDGRSMIETVAYFDADGRPVLRKNFFARIR